VGLALSTIGDDFIEIFPESDQSQTQAKPKELSRDEMADMLKKNIRDIGSALLAEEGIGSFELAYFYGVLMDHVKKKLLNTYTVGLASEANLKHAIQHRYTIMHNFRKFPGLVTSIVKYKKERGNAHK